MRSTPHFNNDEIDNGREIMTDFMRAVRRKTQATAARLGHPVQLAVRVPPRPEFAHGVGLDAVAWPREGLVDMVIVYDVPCLRRSRSEQDRGTCRFSRCLHLETEEP